MKIKTGGIELYYEEYPSETELNQDILMLHGFTGSCKDWEFLVPDLNKNFNVFLLDLIGHGKSDSPSDPNLYAIPSVIFQLDDFINKQKIDKPVITGYSMGGRIALSYTAAHPDKVSCLILESATWGITDNNLRVQREEEDKILAEYISSHEMETFVELWMSKSIFESQKKLPIDLIDKIKRQKNNNNKIGLSNSLRGSGTGTMAPLHESVKLIKAPVLLITGELDKKFTEINAQMKNRFSNARHEIIPGAGHNVHLEKPDLFKNVIQNFLKKINFF